MQCNICGVSPIDLIKNKNKRRFQLGLSEILLTICLSVLVHICWFLFQLQCQLKFKYESIELEN